MNTSNKNRRIAAALLIAALFAPYFINVGFVPTVVSASTGGSVTIVFDMSHGQFKDSIFAAEDKWMADNLTEMGFNIVWAFGGINSTILKGARGLVIGSIYGLTNGFTPAEITAIGTWFNAGQKFVWVSSDSDYAGYNYINTNASAILEAVGSHVYTEPISVSDDQSNCNASYRVVANVTSTNSYVADVVANVDAVLMHGPTCLYGSTSATPGVDAVSLENTTIANVYPVLYYSPAAVISDSDLVPAYAHSDGQVGSFAAMSIEVKAGEDGTGVIAVSGASPYADYQPMTTSEYYEVPLNGMNLVLQTFEFAMTMVTPPVIVFDMSHGQFKDSIFTAEDAWLVNNLTAMGYDSVFAFGGINSSILARATGLVIGSIYGLTNGFTPAEITAIGTWFNAGHKLIWVSSDSDYAGYNYINTNASAILEAVGSHVYTEPISVSDDQSNCNASYRVVANVTSTNPFVADLVANVDAVLMHGPTCLYGSTSATPGVDAVALENTTIPNVYPVLYYSPAAVISDSDLVPAYAHSDGQVGSFVAMSVEINAGEDGTGVIVVTGASPYADYQPMTTSEYYEVPLNGMNLVKQTFGWGIEYAISPPSGFAIDPILLIGIVAAAAIVVIIVVIVIKRR